MSSRGVGAFRPVARTGVIASSIALLAMVLSPNAALAATVIGSPAGTMTCAAGFDLVQVASATPGAYVVPAGGGTITSWRTQGDAASLGPVGLQVWRPTSGLDYQLVGASPLVTLAPSVINTFDLAAPIAVQAGDMLGLRIEGVALCAAAASDGSYGGFLGPNPALGAIETFMLFPFAQLNVEATLGTVITPPPPPPPPPTDCDNQDQSPNNPGDQTGDNSGERTNDKSSDKAKQKSKDKADHNDNCEQ